MSSTVASRPLNTRELSAALSTPQVLFDYIDGERDKVDMSIAQELLVKGMSNYTKFHWFIRPKSTIKKQTLYAIRDGAFPSTLQHPVQTIHFSSTMNRLGHSMESQTFPTQGEEIMRPAIPGPLPKEMNLITASTRIERPLLTSTTDWL
jgi:hypothetical protein